MIFAIIIISLAHLSPVLCHAATDITTTFFRRDNTSQKAFSLRRIPSLRGGGSTPSSSTSPPRLLPSSLSSSPPNSRLDSIIRGGGTTYDVSIHSTKGSRPYMEDEYIVVSPCSSSNKKQLFAAVFDGHGGSAVSRYLRHNLYANFQAASLPLESSSEDCRRALREAFRKVDEEVQRVSHWSFQGSTAVSVLIRGEGETAEEDDDVVVVSANVGDSRAILCRRGRAVDLTTDHKPNEPTERARVEALGGEVRWCGARDGRTGRPLAGTGVYRINGNLALSRAIGDRSERPLVSADVDMEVTDVCKGEDEFVLLASDGLWDVMGSQEVVDFVCERLRHEESRGDSLDVMNVVNNDNTDFTLYARIRNQTKRKRKKMAKHLVKEALRRGSVDNITVIIVWLDDINDDTT